MIYTIDYPVDAGKKYEEFSYPAGEKQVRILPDQIDKVQQAEEVLVFATITNGEVMGILLLLDAVRSVRVYPKSHVKLIMPYLPYARADRRFAVGDCSGLHMFLKALDTEVFSLDAHPTKSMAGVVNIKPTLFIKAAIENICGSNLQMEQPNLCLLFPDEGAAKRYSAHDFGLPFVYGGKLRDPKTGKLSGFRVPEIPDSLTDVLIVDDICDGGGTFLGLTEQLKGKKTLFLYVTHGIFSKGVKILTDRFQHVYTTDSFPHHEGEGLITMPCRGAILDQILTKEQLWANAAQK